MDYREVNSMLRAFIYKYNDGETPIIELISEFCLKSGLSEEMVGDVISEDQELTDLIAWNMKSEHNNTLDNF